MFRKAYCIFFTLLFFKISAQEVKIQENDSIANIENSRPQTVKYSAWKQKFKISALVNQTAFNNDWQGGGTSNLATNAKLDYKVNFKKGSWALDNIIRLAYGVTKLDDEEKLRKTDDNVELNTTLFKNIENSLWSYSTFFSFKSQFEKGYNFKKDKSKTLISDALSPAFFHFTQKKAAFGVEKGESKNIEFGSSIVANYKFILAKNVTIENLLNLYSNYMGNIANVDINYRLNMNSKINKHMSANFTFQTIYDDDTVKAFQVRELISLGLNYEI